MTIESQLYGPQRRHDLELSSLSPQTTGELLTYSGLRDHLERAGGLVSAADLQRRWGRSKSVMSRIVNLTSFPEPVYTGEGNHRLWITAEVDVWWASRRAR